MATLYGYKLLVVDDSPSMCLLAEALLKDVVAEIRHCTSGREALEMWARWKPRVVLVDYEMPALNGIFFAKALRELECGASPKTVLLMVTSHVKPAVIEEARDAGYNAFIPKPLTAEAVVVQMERIRQEAKITAQTIQFM
jgi:CheY-like chemotaxis protein